MPCWLINRIPVSFKHREILEKAIDAGGFEATWSGETVRIEAGAGLTIDLNAQQATTYDDMGTSTLNKLKRAYSKGVLKKAAQKNKWQMQVSAGNSNKGFFRKG